jgi:trimethylamine--corrinoid protein Co-methyltransferase
MKQTVKRFNAPPLRYLTEEQMKEIHAAAIEILEDLGTVVHHEEAVDLLGRAGAFVQDKNRVYISAALVEAAIRSAPGNINIYDREGTPVMCLGGRQVYYGTGSDCPNLLDSFSGERRHFLAADVEKAVRLVDALPHIDFTMSMGLAPDVPSDRQYQHKYAFMLRNTTKPQVITAADRTSLKDIADMAAAVRGGRAELSRKPLFVLYDEPTSPLVHTHEALDKLLFMAEYRLPVNYSPGIMAGATAPVTLAGAIAQATAEILAGLVIHQLKMAGAPFVFGGGMSPMDMQSTQPTYSSPEAVVSQAGLCQLGRELYRLPSWGFGGCSASKLADEQAVYEAGLYILMAGLMGTNIVHDVGYLEFGKTYSFDLLVMCDEMIGYVRRMMEGIPVDPENLAVDAIKRVGIGGHFLGDAHTLAHFRDNWQPGITDRRTFDAWQERGGTSMGQRAKDKVKEILESHQPKPIAPDADTEIEKILEKLK